MSNRLTFSLASLVLIFAFGLVFGTVSVIADDGGTAIPAGGDTANHGTDGHADQNAANAAENNAPSHKHPQLTISAKDADPTTTGIQVVPTAEAAATVADPAAADWLTIEFPIEITIPASSYDQGTTTRPSATTLNTTNTTGASFIGNAGGGAVGVGTFALKANSTYVITAVATVTLVDDGVAGTTNKAQREAVLAAKTPLEVTITVANNVIVSSDNRGDYAGQSNVEAEMTFTLIPAAVSEKVAWEVAGTPSVTDDFTVTFTADEAGATLTEADIMVDGGTIERFGADPFPPAGKTVYQAEIRPALHARMVSVTIKSSSTTAAPAAGDDGMIEVSIGEATITDISTMPATADDQADFEVVFTFNRALPNPLMLEHLSIGTTAANMMDGDEANDTVTGAADPMFLGTPNRVPGESMKWRVTVSPKKGMDTIIGLSNDGMDTFTYGSGVKALTVDKKGTVPGTTSGDTISATYDDDTKTATLSGSIAAHGFVVIGADDLPDLEAFLFIGGTIGLDDGDGAADKNSRTVVISEILWGLDLGAPVTEETKHQFIELYNTTNKAIPLTDWELIFTEGRSVPASDIDQVSNRSGAGWVADIGQSGRVTGTRAVDPDNTVTPIRIISMYRNINYNKVETEAAKATVNRGELLKGVPGGNAKGSWKASTRHTTNRWIYDSKGRKHALSSAIVSASSVPRSPFVINEIGNGSGDSQDWIELRNVTGDTKSLKNYHLSIVTATGTDNSLINFKDLDYKVPGNGFIVLTNTDPSNTDLAGGVDVSKTVADQVQKGAKHLYYANSGLKLPDDGKFNLILRNAHDKLKASSHFIDAVGMQNYTDQGRGTSFWPLSAIGGKHGDVNNDDGGDGHEDFRSGFVYERTKAGASNAEHTVKVRGFTGIGYDRTVVSSKANGGTPGYDNGALKEKIADVSDGEITISEIMVDSGTLRSNLPQWIEIYNSSLTRAVNLNGWKLEIENAADPDVSTFNAVLTLSAMTISPNQTVLIVSTSGRTSNTDHFPGTRLVNLWTHKPFREELEMVRRTDQVLSPMGFHITLKDKDGNVVDMVGNLDGNRRTRDEASWDIPTSGEEGRRSSLIRTYDDGVAIDGEIAEGWALASNTDLAHIISQTYYGNPDDYGTPGFRAGGPLPVSLSKFRPERLDDGTIAVRWITESELDNAGFNILRSDARDGEFTKLNAQLIEGQGTTSERTAYEFVDKTAKPNVVYYYQIQDISIDGDVTTLRTTRLKGHVSAAGKLTTTWGELKALQ